MVDLYVYKIMALASIPLLSWVPVGLAYLWLRKHRQRLLSNPSEESLREVRSLRLSSFLSQLGILILGASAYALLKDTLHSPTWVTYVPLLFFLVGIWVQGQICGEVEMKLRQVNVTVWDSTMLRMRFWGTMVASYFVYLAVLYLTIRGVHALAHGNGEIVLLATPLGILLGLGSIYMLAPHFVRMMFPTRLVTKSDSIYSLIEECFIRAQLPVPHIRTIELERFQIHNALVAGAPVGGRFLRPTLYLTRSLAQKLNHEELRAVILHEASHLKLRHLLKRFLFSFAAVILSMGPVTAFYVLARQFISQAQSQQGMFIFSIVIALGFQIWLLRKQVRRHEIEADVYAVSKLGASAEALGSALRKLDQSHMLSSRRKDPMSLLNPASAHPTTEERIEWMKKAA